MKIALWKQYNFVNTQFSAKNDMLLNRFPLKHLLFQQKHVSKQMEKKDYRINKTSKSYLQGLFQNNHYKDYKFLKKK